MEPSSWSVGPSAPTCGRRFRTWRSAARPRWAGTSPSAITAARFDTTIILAATEAVLSAVALGNRDLLYRLLFDSAKETLLEVAADPKHLGARIGVLMVLHTWGQKLEHHPHVHCVVSGGGLAVPSKTS